MNLPWLNAGSGDVVWYYSRKDYPHHVVVITHDDKMYFSSHYRDDSNFKDVENTIGLTNLFLSEKKHYQLISDIFEDNLNLS